MSGHHGTLIPSLLRGMIGHPQDEYDVNLIQEASDKFAALIAERDALRAALRKISDTAMDFPYAGATCGEIARAALSAEKGE